MKKFAIAIAAVAALAGTTAHAGESFVKFGFGQGKVDLDCTDIARCDDTGTSSKISAGHIWGNGLGFEVGYANWGKVTAADSGLSLSAKATSPFVGAIYKVGFTDSLSLNTRLGIARVKTKVSASFDGDSGSESWSKAKAYYGVGLEYAITKTVGLSLDIDGTQAEVEGEKADIRSIGLGVNVKF